MPGTSTLQEYKVLVANYLRTMEIERARGDRSRLGYIDGLSDDDLMRKWLWMGSIVGGLAFFIVLPFVFGLINRFIPLIILDFIFWLLKLGMGMVVIIFAFAIYFTVRKSS